MVRSGQIWMIEMYFGGSIDRICLYVYEVRRKVRNDFQDFDLNIWVSVSVINYDGEVKSWSRIGKEN